MGSCHCFLPQGETPAPGFQLWISALSSELQTGNSSQPSGPGNAQGWRAPTAGRDPTPSLRPTELRSLLGQPRAAGRGWGLRGKARPQLQSSSTAPWLRQHPHRHCPMAPAAGAQLWERSHCQSSRAHVWEHPQLQSSRARPRHPRRILAAGAQLLAPRSIPKSRTAGAQLHNSKSIASSRSTAPGASPAIRQQEHSPVAPAASPAAEAQRQERSQRCSSRSMTPGAIPAAQQQEHGPTTPRASQQQELSPRSGPSSGSTVPCTRSKSRSRAAGARPRHPSSVPSSRSTAPQLQEHPSSKTQSSWQAVQSPAVLSAAGRAPSRGLPGLLSH